MKIGLPMTFRVLFTVIERATTYPIFAIRVMLSSKYVKKNELSKLSIQFFSSVWILSTNVLDLYFNLHLYIHVLVLALDQRVDPALIPSPSAKSVPRGGKTPCSATFGSLPRCEGIVRRRVRRKKERN